jgi:hypothetical protein
LDIPGRECVPVAGSTNNGSLVRVHYMGWELLWVHGWQGAVFAMGVYPKRDVLFIVPVCSAISDDIGGLAGCEYYSMDSTSTQEKRFNINKVNNIL